MKRKDHYENNLDINNQYNNVPYNSFIPNINNNNLEKEIILLKNEVKEIKTNIKDINKEIKDMKYLINEIYNIIKYDNNNSNYNKITENKLIKNLNNQPKDNNINDDRKVTVSMGDKNILIIINNDTSFNAFKIIIQKYLNLNSNDIDIYYFNNFAKKIYVSNDTTFKNSIAQKICKYYIIEKQLKPSKSSEAILNPKIQKIIQKPENNSHKKKDVKSLKEDVKEALEHFSSLAFISSEIKKEDFINSTAIVSSMIKKINKEEKKNSPNKFENPNEILKNPGLLSEQINEKDNTYVLSLLSKILEDKGINSSIKKYSQNESELDGASLQYLFGGLTEKKKYKIKLNLNESDNNKFIKKNDELSNLINKFKNKFSKILNIKENDIFILNPKNEEGKSSFDLYSENTNISNNIIKLKEYNKISGYYERPLIEGCQLSSSLFDPKWNNKDGGWAIGEQRGNEDYLPPLGWVGYGLKVVGKYDNGNNDWLGMKNKTNEFAVAYFGISNIYGNEENLNKYMEEIASINILKMGYEQIYSSDEDLRHPYTKCGNGIYLFQNPKIAENTAGIVSIGGVTYKIMLMCRVNPKKIRQPKGFKDCWILNSSPLEIRPYRILVKKIFKSALAGASQNEIKTFESIPSYFKTIHKDTSFYQTKKYKFKQRYNKYTDEDFVIRLYTSDYYAEINHYLKEGKLIEDYELDENQIKSWIWCLHSSICNRKSNIKNGTICYRGIARKFPDNLGIGHKFIFSEFISTSLNYNVAKDIFSGNQTLLKIRIENNNSGNYYCYHIKNISIYQDEDEVLITFGCVFQITKKEKISDGANIIYLTCTGPGFHFNNIGY